MEAVLVVEDDPDVQSLVRHALSGINVHVAETLAAARERIGALDDLSLVLLDLGLPDGDGFSLCSELAGAQKARVPVIFLTGSSDVRDVVTAFSLGAEDYIKKPFAALELRARVLGRLRSRSLEENERVLEIGSLHIHVDKMRTYRTHVGGRCELTLTPTEQRLLQVLSERPGHLLSRENLHSKVWGDSIVGLRTIDTHVSNLRTKLGAAGVDIEAVRGIGYRLAETPLN